MHSLLILVFCKDAVHYATFDRSKELARRGAGFASLTGKPSYETVKNEGDHGKKGG
jgi:hypothetical protein